MRSGGAVLQRTDLIQIAMINLSFSFSWELEIIAYGRMGWSHP